MLCILFQLEETVMPYLDVLATFRDDVRAVARKEKSKRALSHIVVKV